MSQTAVITRQGKFEGLVVEIIPDGYLQEGWAMAEEQKTGIQFPIKKEELLILAGE